MILFVFEGAKREPDLFRAIETLFFQDKQNIVCSFGNNIYELYNELQSFEGDGDIVSILKERYQGQKDSPFTDDAKSSDFSEIYLIFDYDFQNKNISLDVMNSQLEEMLDMFDDETDNGRLYINYPMVEAIRYTKNLPDADYWTYVVPEKTAQKHLSRILQIPSRTIRVSTLSPSVQEGRLRKRKQVPVLATGAFLLPRMSRKRIISAVERMRYRRTRKL